MKHLLSLYDLSGTQIERLINTAIKGKAELCAGKRSRALADKSLAMIFEKPSTRTRVSFEVAMTQLGGHALFLAPEHTQLGRGEPIKDTARVLSRMVDGIMIRTFEHSVLEQFAQYSSVPIINGLSDLLHPCQVLADLMTIKQRLRSIRKPVVAWIGDGNNMTNSWINAAARLGFELRMAVPRGFDPDRAILERAQADRPGKLLLTRDPHEAARDADVVATDTWVSMGMKKDPKRIKAFKGFMVDEALMALAKPQAIFLHCLPAYREMEVSEAVIEGPQSAVFDEAENRLHVQKALLADLLK
ncbi:MAG: ornithine carbamoyltransferase [Candidatus Alcyoniella australis]|nr:ornithine carbamoyltransferase [Candidatus Alcyoniella australis]